MAFRPVTTTRHDYGGRLQTSKNFYDKVKPRPPLGAIDNTQTQKDPAGKSMKQKQILSLLKPVAVRKQEEHVLKPLPPKSPKVEEMDVTAVTQQLSEQLHIEDIDSIDTDNPQLCTEYVKEIYIYMRGLELKYHVPPTYMDAQPHVNPKMRTILVDWLIQVHLKFTLLQETLYLAISVIDRYLSHQPVERSKLQLIGVTAMLIASKYEEMYSPEVRDFVYITDKTYTCGQILQMEREILKELDYSLGNPLCLHFLRRYSRAGEATPEIHTMAKFLMELCLPYYTMLEFRPSKIAASALYLAIQLCGDGQWTPALTHYSTCSESDVLPCVRKIACLIKSTLKAKQQAVRNKYSSTKYLQVSKMKVLEGPIVQTLAQES